MPEVDEHDNELIGHAIRLSMTLRTFLARNKGVLDGLARVDVIDPALLAELREVSEAAYKARVERLHAARGERPDPEELEG